MKLDRSDYLILAALAFGVVLTAVNFYFHQTILNIALFFIVIVAIVGFVVARSR